MLLCGVVIGLSPGINLKYYNRQRFYKSLINLTPAYVYFGRGESILEERRKIKARTMQIRRLEHQLKGD